MQIQFAFSPFDLAMIFFLAFMHGKAMQGSGIRYAEGKNWMPEAFCAACLLFAATGWFAVSAVLPN